MSGAYSGGGSDDTAPDDVIFERTRTRALSLPGPLEGGHLVIVVVVCLLLRSVTLSRRQLLPATAQNGLITRS